MSELDEKALLACPFCGREPDTENAPARGTDIYCAHEDCGGARIFVSLDETSQHGEEAVARWNRRALPAAEEAVRVKPLVWKQLSDATTADIYGTRFIAHTPMGSYFVNSGAHGQRWDYSRLGYAHISASSPDEAKAAAQSDYETRIRSALE